MNVSARIVTSCLPVGEAGLDLAEIRQNSPGPRVLPVRGTPKGQLRLHTSWLPVR